MKKPLPKKDYYTVKDLVAHYGCLPWTIKRAAKKYGIGRLKKQVRGRGFYCFLPEDVPKIAEHIHTKPGRPKKKKDL